MTRVHDWVWKANYWELCKRLKLDQKSKWYVLKTESIQENETHKILWESEIKTDHPRMTDLEIICKKKRTCHLVNFAVPAYCVGKMKENVNIAKYFDHVGILNKLWNGKATLIPIVDGALGTAPKGLEKRFGKMESRELIGRLAGLSVRWLLVLFYVVSTLFGSFNAL